MKQALAVALWSDNSAGSPRACGADPARMISPRLWRALIILLTALGCGENQTHPMRDRYVPGEVAPLGCVPNLDGVIDASELAPAVSVPVSYLVTPAGVSAPVDVAGAVDAAGRRVWDWSAGDGGDQLAVLEAAPLGVQWFADSFPGGEFVAPVDAGGRVLGVYVHDELALWLLGVASSEADPPEGRTRIVYDEPVALYRFPLAPGDEHLSVGEARDATVRGLPYAGRDVYEVRVDGSGVLELPDIGFDQVHRVRTRVTIEPAAGTPTSQRQVSYLFECFGEVARATSLPDEMEEDFTVASEIRRFALE